MYNPHFTKFFSSAFIHKDKYRYVSTDGANILQIENDEEIRKQADKIYKRMKCVKDSAEKFTKK